MLIKRRVFLQTGSLATASFLVPKFLKAFEKNNFVAVPEGNKVVVVLQLSGGNDGLNTVIPIRNDIYYSARPVLGIAKDTALALTDEVALNPALADFRGLFDDGSLGILNTGGYPITDSSRFRALDIWQSATDRKIIIKTGWPGRYR